MTNRKVLVADAQQESLLAMEDLLVRAGFQVRAAWTAKEVLRLLASETFHLLLVNEYLPDAECQDLLRRCRKQGAQVASVVMLASAPEITDTQFLAELGVREVVCKHEREKVLQAVTRSLAGELNFRRKEHPPMRNPKLSISPREPGNDPGTTPTMDDMIRMRAYELYESRGREPGHEVEDWLAAESEVTKSQMKRAAA